MQADPVSHLSTNILSKRSLVLVGMVSQQLGVVLQVGEARLALFSLRKPHERVSVITLLVQVSEKKIVLEMVLHLALKISLVEEKSIGDIVGALLHEQF